MDASSFCPCRVAVAAWHTILVLSLVVLTNPSAHAATICVPADEPTIQAGNDASASGDTVLVAPGTYVGLGNRDIRPGGRGIVVRSESGADETVIDCQGSPGDPHRRFHFFEGEPPTARVEGLTIRGGYATNQLGNDGGGAILCELNASPVIERCEFEGNVAEGLGCALSVLESGVLVRQCAFERTGHETIDRGAAYSKPDPWHRDPPPIPNFTRTCGNSFVFSLTIVAGSEMEFGTPPIFDRSRILRSVPNPFGTAGTRIDSKLAAGAPVRLKVYDVGGRLVRTVVNQRHEAGEQQAFWDGRDEAGRELASGVYLHRPADRRRGHLAQARAHAVGDQIRDAEGG